ncbi:RidA family protein [Bradyrhizobium sp. U87765 SZCCT0131]|uniref:RidA family protein n=1 Tax=unclassified Bradyrhizobium TaxID=2631580 RepID=UPI001BACE45F|nr:MULTISPECIES: RidA family protein [unclassified Bradyrhizobium]MBR1217524.1 RidA family protein [Bradyrhizobium sp. U87765 SZCCT0131]MBR1264878.1 RidA family protein [Bradyrhizobium sp. U87765 SZCCT0134]MBR1304860.1 RidA family protein [Bradyrhizobium sp. U87765 SZCCT0110]MBR1320647.1 RidA family protein [Bradyrhizobium sp. U87765 SZCCT0109]MBR1349067.1 RidA family protein [Bradyrhizobium sp. U87765 SZCCT0048]
MTKQAFESGHPVFATKDGSTIFRKFAYSSAVRAGDFVYVAGQIGLNPDGSMPEDDARQFVNAFDRLKIVLEDAGASLGDIVELVSYHVGLQKHLPQFMEIKNRYIHEPYPTWTILEIAGLARPGLVIEIKAVAYAPIAR